MFDGQSMVYSPAPAAGPNLATGLAASLSPGWGASTPARAGTTYADRSASVAFRVDDLAKNAESFLIDVGGTSDIGAGMSAATLLATVEANADARRAAGFRKVIECTVPPWSGFSGAEETERVAYNAALQANANGKFDAVVDVHSDPLDDPTDATYFQVDQLHWKAAAVTEVVARIKSAVAPLGIV